MWLECNHCKYENDEYKRMNLALNPYGDGKVSE